MLSEDYKRQIQQHWRQLVEDGDPIGYFPHLVQILSEDDRATIREKAREKLFNQTFSSSQSSRSEKTMKFLEIYQVRANSLRPLIAAYSANGQPHLAELFDDRSSAEATTNPTPSDQSDREGKKDPKPHFRIFQSIPISFRNATSWPLSCGRISPGPASTTSTGR